MVRNWRDDTWEKFNKVSMGKKIILWGAGKRCREWLPLWKLTYDISYIVDSDKNKWRGTCCGIKVCPPAEISNEEKGSYVILICGLYAGDIAQKLEEMEISEYYSEYWMNHPRFLETYRIQNDIPQKEIEDVCGYLEDEESKNILKKIVKKREEGVSDYTDIMCEGEYFRDDFFRWSDSEVYVDAGAYDGDSIIQFIRKNSDFNKIYAFEADQKNYEMLRKSYVYQAFKEKMKIFNGGVWDQYEAVNFVAGMDVSSRAVSETPLNMNEFSDSNTQINVVECMPLDDVITEEVTFIKMDIEGSEIRALKGSRHLIAKYKPKLAICIYHKPDDLWKIPQYIHSLVPEYKIYIRHHSILYVDTVLYATI